MRLADLPPHVQAKARELLERQRASRMPSGYPLTLDGLERERADVIATAQRLCASPGTIVIGDPPIARREGDALWLCLNVVPRTKKNGTRSGQHPTSVKRFAHQVRQAIAPHAAALGLPLPDRWYNCAALFTTDNDRGDTVGLMQGLADALEGNEHWCGVLTNDRWIRTWDSTDQRHDPVRPGITLTLTPISPHHKADRP